MEPTGLGETDILSLVSEANALAEASSLDYLSALSLVQTGKRWCVWCGSFVCVME